MFDCLRVRQFPFAETSGFGSETSAVCPSVEIRIAVMPPSCNPNLAVLAEENDTCVWPPVHSNWIKNHQNISEPMHFSHVWIYD